MSSSGKEKKGSLIGKRVLVPAKVWPNIAPPKGKSGWEGKVKDLRTRSPETYWVRFPDDTEKYWFPASDVRSWVVEEAEDGKDDKPESSKAAGKKRQAEEGGSPQKASPQKKEKVSGGRPVPLGGPKLPPRPSSPTKPGSPSKTSKQTLRAELDRLVEGMTSSQLAQLLGEAKKVLSSA